MSDLATKNQVAEFYEDFQSRGKYDYFYGDEKRKNLYIQLIGKGNRILEVGCRSGNLTQFYHEGNQVEGIDVDRNALVEFEKRLKLKGYWVIGLMQTQRTYLLMTEHLMLLSFLKSWNTCVFRKKLFARLPEYLEKMAH